MGFGAGVLMRADPHGAVDRRGRCVDDPLVIVAVVIGYVTTEVLREWRTPTTERELDHDVAAATTAIDLV